MDGFEPSPEQIAQCGQVDLLCTRSGPEASHLADASGVVSHRPPTDDPAQRRDVTETSGVTDLRISGKLIEYRLSELGAQCVAPILAGPAVSANLSSRIGQAEGVAEFTKGEQPGIGCALGTKDLQLQAALEIEPQTGSIPSRPPHDLIPYLQFVLITLIVISELGKILHGYARSSGNRGFSLQRRFISRRTLRQSRARYFGQRRAAVRVV